MKITDKAKRKIKIATISLVVILGCCGGGYLGVDFYKQKTITQLEFKEPSQKEKVEIYKKIYTKKYMEEKQPNLSQMTAKQKQDMKKEIWEKGEKFIKNREALAKLAEKSNKINKSKILLIDDYPIADSNMKLYKKIQLQNKAIEEEYGIEAPKVNYIFNQLRLSERYANYLYFNYKPTKKERENLENAKPMLYKTYDYYIYKVQGKEKQNEFMDQLMKYKDFDKVVDNFVREQKEKDKEIASTIYKTGEVELSNAKFDNKKYATALKSSYFYEIPSYDMANWITSQNRKKNDIQIFNDSATGSMYIVQYVGARKNTSNTVNIDALAVNSREFGIKYYEELKKAKDKDKKIIELAQKLDIDKFNSSKYSPIDDIGTAFNMWVYDKDRKKNDIALINTPDGYMIVKFNHKNKDNQLENELNMYLKKIYSEEIAKIGVEKNDIENKK